MHLKIFFRNSRNFLANTRKHSHNVKTASKKAIIMPNREDTARAFAEAFAHFGNQEQKEEEKEPEAADEENATDPPPRPPSPPSEDVPEDVEEEDEVEAAAAEEEDDHENEEEEKDEEDVADRARAEDIRIAQEEFDGWWALRAEEGADDVDAVLVTNNITLDTVRDGVVSKRTLRLWWLRIHGMMTGTHSLVSPLILLFFRS
jgi:archaellum component FlaD/FlaE